MLRWGGRPSRRDMRPQCRGIRTARRRSGHRSPPYPGAITPHGTFIRTGGQRRSPLAVFLSRLASPGSFHTGTASNILLGHWCQCDSFRPFWTYRQRYLPQKSDFPGHHLGAFIQLHPQLMFLSEELFLAGVLPVNLVGNQSHGAAIELRSSFPDCNGARERRMGHCLAA